MSRTPEHITFTGVDETTSIDDMVALAARYPIEWGVLFHRRHQGGGRYPGLDFIASLMGRPELRLAAHLCGEHAAEVIDHGDGEFDAALDRFGRVQVNTAREKIDHVALGEWAERCGTRAILQWRGDEFPRGGHYNVDWLYDRSGGRGLVAELWPLPVGGVLRGYAGGLAPENVAGVIDVVGCAPNGAPYWIDMETGVRTDGCFDLRRCEAVCRAVYGEVR